MMVVAASESDTFLVVICKGNFMNSPLIGIEMNATRCRDTSRHGSRRRSNGVRSRVLGAGRDDNASHDAANDRGVTRDCAGLWSSSVTVRLALIRMSHAMPPEGINQTDAPGRQAARVDLPLSAQPGAPAV